MNFSFNPPKRFKSNNYQANDNDMVDLTASTVKKNITSSDQSLLTNNNRNVINNINTDKDVLSF